MAAGQSVTTVLIVEDDQDARLVAGAHLRERGYRVLTADSAEDGLSMAADESADVIVLAATLPGRGGWPTLTDLQQDPSTVDIPVVMLVDERQAADASTPWSGGATAFLTKPFSPDALSELVGAALGTDRSHAEEQ